MCDFKVARYGNTVGDENNAAECQRPKRDAIRKSRCSIFKLQADVSKMASVSVAILEMLPTEV